MDRATSTLVIVSVILVLLALMIVGWRRRARRQGGLGAPLPVSSGLGEPSILVPVLYVATTLAGAPLDRVAVHGLGFRARGEIGVHAEGIVLVLAGREPVFIPVDDVRGSGRATWTIDRVVEEGGLVLIAWRLDGADVDSYVRVTDDRTPDLIAALAALRTTERPAL